MTWEASKNQPRREFLKLAALTGAAAFTPGQSTASITSTSPSETSPVDDRVQRLELLRVKNSDIVDSHGKKIRLRGTCPGGWMNMEDFINGHPGAEHTLRAQMAEALGESKAQFFFDRITTRGSILF